MHRWLAFAAVLALAADAFPDNAAQPSARPMKEQIHAVVGGQLEAFRKNDFAAAYTFAAAQFRAQFSLPDFEKMVRTGYPAIAGNQDAVYGLTLDDGEKAVVNVRVIGEDKKSVSYQYLLQREGEDWRIGGVVALGEQSSL